MNKLKPDTQVAVLNALVEGSSIRSVERMTGVHRDTITRLLVRVGDALRRRLRRDRAAAADRRVRALLRLNRAPVPRAGVSRSATGE